MRYTEKDRREIINKLKKIKDPRERDKILWALEGVEETYSHHAPSPAPPSIPETSRPAPGHQAPSGAPGRRDVPRINIAAGRMFAFVVPAFFVLFGLIRIGKAALNYITSQDIEAEMTGLITGGIFLIIGLAGVFSAMRAPRIKQDDVS